MVFLSQERLGLLLQFLTSLLMTADGYKHFQERVPNGDRVPNPCQQGTIWPGVGHTSLQGGGERNPFGLDFHKNGLKWDECLCRYDSDGDGTSNGEELGDPDCTWRPGQVPTRTSQLSHPGICEPLNNPNCKQNSWLDCEAEQFSCPAIKDPAVKNISLRFPRTKVPARETNYMCMTFDLPTDGDFHLIATKPEIDNSYVMHHILLFACDPDTEVSGTSGQPERCGMSNRNCRDIIGLWTLGLQGQCFGEEYGFRIGTRGYKQAVMQMHWNNPELDADYWDSSGLTLYYTDRLRPNDAGVIMTGPRYLEIPPGLAEVTQTGTCPAECTKNLPFKLNVVEASLHMHYMGIGGSTELYRNGQKIADFYSTNSYSYDNPEFKRFDTPLEVQAGDEVRTTCKFNSTSKTDTVYFGQATSEEMCLGFMIYYPLLPTFTRCLSYKSQVLCNGKTRPITQLGACNLTAVFLGAKELGRALLQACSNRTCTPGCQAKIDDIESRPCFQGDARNLVEEIANMRFKIQAGLFFDLLHLCDPDPVSDESKKNMETEEKHHSDDEEHGHKKSDQETDPHDEGQHAYEPTLCSMGEVGGATCTTSFGVVCLLAICLTVICGVIS